MTDCQGCQIFLNDIVIILLFICQFYYTEIAPKLTETNVPSKLSTKLSKFCVTEASPTHNSDYPYFYAWCLPMLALYTRRFFHSYLIRLLGGCESWHMAPKYCSKPFSKTSQNMYKNQLLGALFSTVWAHVMLFSLNFFQLEALSPQPIHKCGLWSAPVNLPASHLTYGTPRKILVVLLAVIKVLVQNKIVIHCFFSRKISLHMVLSQNRKNSYFCCKTQNTFKLLNFLAHNVIFESL